MTDPLAVVAERLGPRAGRDVPIGPLTTYRVGGRAALLVEVHREDDLVAVSAALRGSRIPVLVVGRGSNLLVADAGFPGLALLLGEEFATIEVDGLTVRAGAAVSLPVLARRTAALGLTGLEWAVGVPGSVGGGVRMNAGGHGSDISRTLVRARLFDLGAGHARTVDVAHLAFGYRRSSVTPDQVVLEAEFLLAPGDREASEREVAEIVRWRRKHQPGGSNAGSVFTNPPGDAAGRLIEAAGLKGFRVGTAFVSPKHANFIQADEGGSADDVHALLRTVQQRVVEATGVHLSTEVHLVGFPSTAADQDLSPST
ncbi:MAG: UDP-N-acetylmuramate dehydrogenase [Actinomycetota bacterium]|nr:UDP-N-acetylmuramate dehydrogenase [Actinomycetota bacterium]